MAKKTARPATNTKPAQQRSKEEQWRKRMAAQARTTGVDFAPTNGSASAVAEPEDEVLGATTERIVPVGASASARTTPTRAQSPAASRAGGASAVRRPLPPRGPRAQANALTVEEEMHFISRDIRKLIVLTAICIAIIIILAFVVPLIVP